MTMSKELGKLEEEALKRKERLANLKRKFDGNKSESNGNGQDKSADKLWVNFAEIIFCRMNEEIRWEAWWRLNWNADDETNVN